MTDPVSAGQAGAEYVINSASMPAATPILDSLNAVRIAEEELRKTLTEVYRRREDLAEAKRVAASFLDDTKKEFGL
jgi:hypothetical protein